MTSCQKLVWEDSHGKCQADLLAPYLEPNSKVLSFYTTLNPSPSETETFTTNQVTELATLTFPSSLNPEEHKKLNSDLINLRVALTEKLDENRGRSPGPWRRFTGQGHSNIRRVRLGRRSCTFLSWDGRAWMPIWPLERPRSLRSPSSRFERRCFLLWRDWA